MVLNIASFEFRQHLRRISTYVYFVVFLLISGLFTAASGGAIPQAVIEFGTGGKILVNSPYALNNIISYVAFFGLIITAAITGQATYKDIASNSASLFYTAPLTKFQYLAGRYLGALATLVVVFSSVGLGAWVGTHLPWIDPTRLGPHRLAPYFQAYFLLVIPNLLLSSAIFFGLSALGRKMLPVYAGSVLLMLGYFLALQLSSTLTVRVKAALVDPLGGSAIDRLTQFWTPFERNTRLIPLQGVLLLNRVLWLAIGLAVLAFTYWKFRLAYPEQAQKRPPSAELREPAVQPLSQTLPVVHTVFSPRASLQNFLSLSRLQLAETCTCTMTCGIASLCTKIMQSRPRPAGSLMASIKCGWC